MANYLESNSHTLEDVEWFRAARAQGEAAAWALEQAAEELDDDLGNLLDEVTPWRGDRETRDKLLSKLHLTRDQALMTWACTPIAEEMRKVTSSEEVPAGALRLAAVYPDVHTLTNIAEATHVPADVLVFLAGHPFVRVRHEVAGLERELPRECQELLVSDPEWGVRDRTLECNEFLDEDLVCRAALEDPDDRVVETALRHEKITLAVVEEMLERSSAMSQKPEWFDALLMAGVRTGDPTMIHKVANLTEKKANSAVTAALLAHPNTPVELLVEAAKRGTRAPAAHRVAVVSNPSTPAEYLVKLVKAPSRAVARAAAENPNLPAEALEVLTAHRDPETVRLAFAHPNVPVARLRKAELGPQRRGAAENPNTPPNVLHAWVVEALKVRTGYTYWNRAEQLDAMSVVSSAADNPSLPRKTWDYFMKKRRGGDDFMSYVVEAKSPPPDLLVKAAMSSDWVIRESAVAHPLCPDEGKVAAALIRDDEDEYSD